MADLYATACAGLRKQRKKEPTRMADQFSLNELLSLQQTNLLNMASASPAPYQSHSSYYPPSSSLSLPMSNAPQDPYPSYAASSAPFSSSQHSFSNQQSYQSTYPAALPPAPQNATSYSHSMGSSIGHHQYSNDSNTFLNPASLQHLSMDPSQQSIVPKRLRIDTPSAMSQSYFQLTQQASLSHQMPGSANGPFSAPLQNMSSAGRPISPPLTPHLMNKDNRSVSLDGVMINGVPATSKAATLREGANGEQMHVCPHPGCNKAFPRYYSLKSHLLCHSNDRPHVCRFCNAAFARKHDLQRHTRTLHNGTPRSLS